MARSEPDEKRRYGGRWREGQVRGRPVAVLMPHTFMNDSGISVKEAVRKKHVALDRLTVIHDDLDFPFGTVRCRQGGGHGGHNGLQSIMAELGAADFARVRIGIGRPEDPEADIKEWVLTDLDAPGDEVRRVMETAAGCAESIITVGIETAMARFNRREKEQPAEA